MLFDSQASVLAAVDELTTAMVELLGHLVRSPSIGGSDAENDAQSELAGLFGAGGLEVDHWRIPLDELEAEDDFPGMEVARSEAWGLVGRLPGTGAGPTLMLNGHIDVVPPGDPATWTHPPFFGAVRAGRMLGRGSCDMKAGLVASYWATQAIRRSGVRLQGDLLVASVQGEEDGGLGTYATLRRGWTADACVIPEPTDLAVVPANAGALTFRLCVHGHATHASRRTEGISAVERFWPIWQALQELEARRHRQVDPLARRWALAHPISIGTVQAGGWASSVPDLLVAEGRLGVAIDEPVESARQDFEDTIAAACAADDWLRTHPVDVEWWGGQFASGRLPSGSDLLDRTLAAHAVATGGGPVPEVWGAPYGSDLRLMVGLAGIPTLQYGPGDVALAHGPDESVVLADVATTARTLAMLALDVCQVV